MQADHFDQQKLLALAAEDVALAQLAHRRRTLPELAAVEAAQEARADPRRRRRPGRDRGAATSTASRSGWRPTSTPSASARPVTRRRIDGGATAKEIDRTAARARVAEAAAVRPRGPGARAHGAPRGRRGRAGHRAGGLAGAQGEQEQAEQLRDAALADIADATTPPPGHPRRDRRHLPADLLSSTTGSARRPAAPARRAQGPALPGLPDRAYGTELAAVRNADPHEVLRCENCGRVLVRTAESGL